MKNFTLALVLTLSLAFGITSVKASEITNPETSITCENVNYIEIRVYENGAIWVYVYTEDGIFVSKHEEL